MLNPIVPAAFSSLGGSGKSAAGLEAQLDQYKIKLADWENCPSCKTPEGKAKIVELTDKIGEIEQRLQAADAARREKRLGIADAARASAAVPPPVPTYPRAGSRLDVFA